MEENKVPRLELNPPLPSLPSSDEKTLVDVRYVIVAPYVSAHVHWDIPKREVLYEIEEPTLNDTEKDILKSIKKEMEPMMVFEFLMGKTLSDLLDYIDKAAKMTLIGSGLDLNMSSYDKIFYYLYRDFIGFNEIEGLMRDPSIREIVCSGANSPIMIIHSVYGNMQTNIAYKEVESLASFVGKLAQRLGGEVNDSSPFVEGAMPDGSRVSIYYTTKTTSKGSTFNIKKRA
jgi:archaeal flagellar protein FlaI